MACSEGGDERGAVRTAEAGHGVVARCGDLAPAAPTAMPTDPAGAIKTPAAGRQKRKCAASAQLLYNDPQQGLVSRKQPVDAVLVLDEPFVSGLVVVLPPPVTRWLDQGVNKAILALARVMKMPAATRLGSEPERASCRCRPTGRPPRRSRAPGGRDWPPDSGCDEQSRRPHDPAAAAPSDWRTGQTRSKKATANR